MWEVLGLIVTVVVPLLVFAYSKPKGFGVVKMNVTFYIFLVWGLIILILNLAKILELSGIITVNTKFVLLDLIRDASLGDLTVIIFAPSIIIWVIMSAFEKASRLPKE